MLFYKTGRILPFDPLSSSQVSVLLIFFPVNMALTRCSLCKRDSWLAILLLILAVVIFYLVLARALPKARDKSLAVTSVGLRTAVDLCAGHMFYALNT